MNRQQAQRKIRETFEHSFTKERFVDFIRNLLNEIDDAPFTYQGNYIPDAYKHYIRTLERIGKFSDGENRIDILVIKLRKETSLERARTMQRNFIAWYLNGSRGGVMKDAALVAYVSPGKADWRFSLVRMDYKFEKTKTGKMKVKEEFTPARRWSFLVGENEKSHTAQSRLVNILENDKQDPTLKEIENAFDIETVTKEFFLKYRELFLRTKEELDKVVKKHPKVRTAFEARGVDTVNFAKKLLGQIVFLYFLQKKGWFGVGRDDDWGTGSKHFLRELFDKKHADYDNFFNDILEPLFYEALRIGEDRRHENYYYSRFNCKIPFLNGGLFDPIGNDGGYDWAHTDILLPNNLFSNTSRTKEGDIGDGILDIFDRYNFTVREDEPLEKEVAIDPELLGKAYEKFNAIRPDNYADFRKALKSGRKGEENKFNKKFGVYYTPREIVHYMCQQSLINYLNTELNRDPSFYQKLGDPQLDMFGNKGKKGQLDLVIEHKPEIKIKKEDIETLIHFGEQLGEYEETVLIKEQKINAGKQKASDYKSKLPESIRNNAALIDRKLKDITICDPAVGSGAFPVGMMSEIVRARNVLSTFIQDNTRTPYEFKRRCIEHSLYGVDIDPGAAEIAKLRLWLSLVVDEEDVKHIKPLPNLDYKILCGNSLLGVEKNLFNHRFFDNLEELKPLYFNETDPTKKQEYRKQIDDLISRITSGHTEFDFKIYFSEVFHRKGGFDVVIANPPYVKEYVNRSAFDGLRNSPYYMGKMDIWYIFACKGIDLLENKGVLCFIAQNNWVTSYGAKRMRNKVLSDSNILQLLDFGDYKIFENTGIQTMIMLFQKAHNQSKSIYKSDFRKLHFSNKVDFRDVLDLLSKTENEHVEYLTPHVYNDNFINKPILFSNENVEKILDKLKKRSNFILDKHKEVAQGIVYPQDFLNKKNKEILGNNFKVGQGIFVLSDEEKNSTPFTESELKLIKPEYTTKELFKYYANPINKHWVIYADSSFRNPNKIKKYPNIKKHLDRFRKVITSDNKPYGLHRARDEKFFTGEKIISVRKCAESTFTYTDFDCYVSATFYVIKSRRINKKFLTALLNSKLIAFWLRHKGKMQGNNYQIDKAPLMGIPIVRPEKNQQIPIINLVDRILAKKECAKNTSDEEREIDQFVYKLYDLTPEEIKIVEGENKYDNG